MISSGHHRFRPGEAIAYRNRVRIDSSRLEYPSFVQAMTVIHDTTAELALLHRPGERHLIRSAEHGGPGAFRHRPVVRWLDGWNEEPAWGRWRRIVLKEPSANHAISLFIVDATGALDFWYVDLAGPLERTRAGFDFTEHGLDMIIEPDLSSWKWKDEDELEWAVAEGCYTRAESDALHAEGERAVEKLVRERARFERWLDWRADPSWPVAQLPPLWAEHDEGVPARPLADRV